MLYRFKRKKNNEKKLPILLLGENLKADKHKVREVRNTEPFNFPHKILKVIIT